MTEPKRIQLSRTKGWRKPEGVIVVARPSRWGNPFRVGDIVRLRSESAEVFAREGWVDVAITPEMAVHSYRRYLDAHPLFRIEAFADLGGHDLACWCPLDQPCHADVLLEVANS